jgi:hypothetical protein
MSRRLLTRVRNQWAGFLALFLVLAGGTAWALAENSVGSKQIKPGAVHSSDLADSAAAQLASGRIHYVGDSDLNTHMGPVPLLPGLSYSTFCTPGAYSRVIVSFSTDASNGTANAMAVASGIENSVTPFPDSVVVANAAQNTGFAFTSGAANVITENGSGEAAAETQLILDVGARTYSVALHIYQRASDGYCEAFGTATLAH